MDFSPFLAVIAGLMLGFLSYILVISDILLSTLQGYPLTSLIGEE